MRNEKKGKVSKVERKEGLLNRLHLYAEKHRDNQEAAEALMSFFRGDCNHLTDIKGKCELCGTNLRQREKEKVHEHQAHQGLHPVRS